MRRDKESIFKLRQEGKSFRQIQLETGVSRATLSVWFKEITWSKHTSSANRRKDHVASKERMMRMNMSRKLSLQWKYALMEKEAEKEYAQHRNDALFWAGLMIYAGEGDKKSRHLIRISTSEGYLHRIFVAFVKKYIGVQEETLRFGLLLSPDHDEATCKKEWEKMLSVQNPIFYKTQLAKQKEGLKRLQYGVAMSIISSTSLKKKLLKWLSLGQDEQFNIDAVIV